MNQIKLITVAVTLILLAGCTGCNNSESREKPDVSGISVNLQILRFDQDLGGFRTHEYKAWHDTLQNKYGDLYNFYVSHFIIGPRPAGDTANIEEDAVNKYLQDRYIKTIQDSINARFTNMQATKTGLEQAFKYLIHYFPDHKVPQIITINSGYEAGASPYGADKFIIGLDMFLGSENKDYDSAGVYQYLLHKMRPEYIPRYAMEAIYESDYAPVNVPPDQTLIEAIIDRGKKLYFLSYILPDARDSMILGYTQTQTDWCKSNELHIWQFLNDKDLLYKGSSMDKMRYLGEGPTTSGMPPEAPGTMGNFIGLQIVKKFMKETDHKISLKDMVLKYDAKTIMEKAKYRPDK